MAAFIQDLRFARTHDALNIAYAVSGRGYPLVRAATWMSNVERDWRTAVLGPLFRELSDRFTLYGYNPRGYGMEIGAFGQTHRLPTVCEFRFLAQAGCLVSYGPPLQDLFDKAAAQADRILKGAKPADMPVEQVTRFELVINQRTARLLGIAIPQALLVLAAEVID